MAKKSNIDQFVSDCADDIGVQAADVYMQYVGYLRKRCGSPIEELMAAAIYCKSPEWLGSSIQAPGIWWLCVDTTWPEVTAGTFDGVFGYQQAHVGRYRVDFLFLVQHEGKRHFVVVECDGHDYHERTKEQASHDKARDRWMASQDISILRFTGSEIFKDPLAAGEQVCEFIAALQSKIGG